MGRYIVHCDCGDTGDFAKTAYKMLFPNAKLPQVLEGRLQTKDLAKTEPGIRDYLMALVNSDEAYAYYFNTDNGIEAWDLLKGVRAV